MILNSKELAQFNEVQNLKDVILNNLVVVLLDINQSYSPKEVKFYDNLKIRTHILRCLIYVRCVG